MVSLGQRLYQERIRKKLSIEEIAQATKIKARFLSAIEKGDYAKLPSSAYAQGFVLNYAAFLGLPKTEVTALFKREFDEKKIYKVLPDALVKTEEFPINRVRIQQSIFFALGLLLLFSFYLLFQYRSAFFAPSLTISSPKQNSTVSDEITIMGKTDVDTTVSVDDQPTSVNSNGEFTKTLTLFSGKNTVIIKAKNRFGKEIVVKREVVVK